VKARTRSRDYRDAIASTVTRRGFLTGAAAATVAAGGLGSAFAASGNGGISTKPLSQALPARPYHPISWPIRNSNRPIPGGQLPERDAVLQVFCWPGRVAQQCLDDFGRKYRCQVQLTTFGTMTEAIATLTRQPARFDVVLGATIATLGQFVTGNLLQPLNHDYVPNIGQTWGEFIDPFYDQNWHYTVPYTIFTTGIGWRRDLVDADPSALLNGWSVLWDARYAGKVGLLDDYREGISLGLLESGNINLNTADPLLIDEAGRSLSALVDLVHPRRSTAAYLGLGTGQVAITQAWSGQVAAAIKYLPAGMPKDVLGYWYPPDGAGPVANDLMVIPRGARNPVLAHLMLNFMLNQPNAVTNVRGTGFMQPLTWMTPERLVNDGALPRNLVATAVLQDYFYRGAKELQLQTGANALWQQVWQSVAARMSLAS
jgi:spermidine/putrescine transport system substrate-binding protein